MLTSTDRPAFDCRGTLTVSFPRNGRAISIKYEHTPTHQTVAQLKEMFKPPPRPAPPSRIAESKTPKSAKPKTPRSSKPKTPKDPSQASAAKTPKTPRPPKTPRAPKTPHTPAATENSQATGATKRRPSTAGESSKPRKRAKKKDGDSNAGSKDSDSLFVDSNHPTYNTPSTGPSDGAPSSTGASAVQPPSGPSVSSFPNITAVEAARRKDAANRMLSDAGVDPATLSSEQFSIFANQSPELQKDSLAMLVKYGAERLRIVQPTTGTAGQQTTAATPSTQSSAHGAVTTKELVPQPRNSLPNTPEGGKQQGLTDSAGNSSRKMAKSRLACFQCKERRVKVSYLVSPREAKYGLTIFSQCSKERPTCEECTKESRPCSYPPQSVRNRSRKKPEATAAQSDDEEDEDEETEASAAAEPQTSSASNWQMPVAGMLGTTVEPAFHNPQPEAPSYYQSANGMPLQHLDNSNAGTDLSAASGLALLQQDTHGAGGSITNPASSLQHHPPSNSQGIDPTATQNGRGSRASMHSSNSPTYPHQVTPTQPNASQGHRRSTSAAQRERLQRTASPRTVAATQAPSRASPLQQVESARTTPRQGPRDQARRPANTVTTTGSAPAAQARGATTNMSNPLQQQGRYDSHNTSRATNAGSAETIPYQPYAYGNPSQQARDHGNNVAVSLPSTMPSTSASYPTLSAGSQWPRGGTQPAGDRSYSTVNSYIQNANNQSSARNFSLRGSSDGEGTGSAGQNQGSQRDYQSFGSQPQPQQQQNTQQPGQAQQNNNWFGVNNANSGGSYNSFGQYWP